MLTTLVDEWVTAPICHNTLALHLPSPTRFSHWASAKDGGKFMADPNGSIGGCMASCACCNLSWKLPQKTCQLQTIGFCWAGWSSVRRCESMRVGVWILIFMAWCGWSHKNWAHLSEPRVRLWNVPLLLQKVEQLTLSFFVFYYFDMCKSLGNTWVILSTGNQHIHVFSCQVAFPAASWAPRSCAEQRACRKQCSDVWGDGIHVFYLSYHPSICFFLCIYYYMILYVSICILVCTTVPSCTIYLFICLALDFSLSLSLHTSIYPSLCLSVCLPTSYLPTSLPTCLPAYIPTYDPIYLSIFLLSVLSTSLGSILSTLPIQSILPI